MIKTDHLFLKLSALLVVGLSWVPAAEADYQYTVVEGAAIITGYDGNEEIISIPATIDAYPVTEIGEEAFYQQTSIIELELPASIAKIGNRAFSECKSLASITFTEGLIEIGTAAFSGSRVTDLHLPNSLVSMGDRSFEQSLLLNSVTLGADLRRIGENAFAYCANLRLISLPDGLESIGNQAFSKCLDLLSLHIPASVTEIGGNIFFDCREFEGVTVAAENAHYRSENGVLFTKDMRRLMAYPIGKWGNTYTIPEGVEEIDSTAFYRAYPLASVELPSTLKRIGNIAFFLCVNIRSFEFPDGLVFIGDSAFGNCRAMDSITVPATVASIGDRAFADCSSLQELTFLGNRPGMLDSILDDSPVAKVYHAFATHGWDAPVAGIEAEPIRVGIWADTGLALDQWRQQAFMGWMHFPQANWVYHPDFRWMYPVGHHADGFYFYDAINKLWCWTSEAVFPHVYQLDPVRAWAMPL